MTKEIPFLNKKTHPSRVASHAEIENKNLQKLCRIIGTPNNDFRDTAFNKLRIAILVANNNNQIFNKYSPKECTIKQLEKIKKITKEDEMSQALEGCDIWTRQKIDNAQHELIVRELENKGHFIDSKGKTWKMPTTILILSTTPNNPTARRPYFPKGISGIHEAVELVLTREKSNENWKIGRREKLHQFQLAHACIVFWQKAHPENEIKIWQKLETDGKQAPITKLTMQAFACARMPTSASNIVRILCKVAALTSLFKLLTINK